MSCAFERFFCCCFFAVLVFGLVLGRLGFASGVSDGDVSDAGARVGRAFEAVLEAEGAGANVSSLMSDLDEAGEFLAEAEISYRNGNLTDAVGLADRCSGLAEAVSVEAVALKGSALADSQQAFESAFIFSTGGAAVLVEALILSWFLFKRAHARKLLGMKCEVVSDAEA
jgi:hypothetical protein